MASTDEAPSGLLHISASLDLLTKEVQRNNRLMTAWIQRASDTNRNVFVRWSAVVPSGGTVPTTLIGNEVGGIGPEPGEVWILRACRIGGVTPTTTAAGRGDTFVSPSDPTAAGATPNTANWIDQATTLPLVAFYSGLQVVLRAPDNFFVVVTNGTAGQQYTANAMFEIYHDGAYQGEIAL